jgi:hypothetical protein
MNFDLVGAAIALWKGINGGKFNAGAATVLLTFGFQKFLPQLGLGHDQTTIMVSTIIQAAGYGIMIVGAIHKIIKGVAAKKAAAVGTVTGTADNTISGGTISK